MYDELMMEDSTQKHAFFTEANTAMVTDSLASPTVYFSYFLPTFVQTEFLCNVGPATRLTMEKLTPDSVLVPTALDPTKLEKITQLFGLSFFLFLVVPIPYRSIGCGSLIPK